MKKEDLINEGEAITEGLERFLDRELAGLTKEPEEQDRTNAVENPASQAGQAAQSDDAMPRSSDRQLYDMTAASENGRSSSRNPRANTAAPSGRSRSGSDGRKNEKPRRSTDAHAGKVRKNTDRERKQPGGKQKGEAMKKGKKKKKSGAKKILLLFLFLLVLFGVIWYIAVGSVYRKMNYEKAEELTAGPLKEDGVTNILLIGNDSRSQGEDGRSDAMILVSISNKTKKIYMTSFLRDIYVDIPGKEGNRLNAAYAYGGPTLLLQTIEQNFDIEVNRYVLVNFQAFANLVDAVGGIDLELTNDEVKWVNAYLNEYNLLEGRDITTDYLDESLSGNLHLNGPQALAYCRNRYIGTDFERTNRQRKVLSAVSGKLPAALATNSTELFEGLFPQLTTNLTQSECYMLSLQASKLLAYEMVQSSIPIEGSYQNATIRSMQVLQIDFDKNKEYIRQNIYGEE